MSEIEDWAYSVMELVGKNHRRGGVQTTRVPWTKNNWDTCWDGGIRGGKKRGVKISN